MTLKRIRSGLLEWLAFFRKTVFYLRAELRDVRDTYLAGRMRKANSPLGFVLVGGRSQHHIAMQKGIFEPEETALFVDCLRDTDVFVDIGANIGYYSAIARHAGKHVICVEPLASNLDLLYATLEVNHWSDVEIFPMGVGKEPGVANLYGASGTGASLLKNWAGASSIFRRAIPLTTLDILVGDRLSGKRLFIKIDVEGLEYQVLQGSGVILAMNPKPTWLVEITLNEYHPDGMNPNFLQIFEIFWAHGYVATTADSSRQKVRREDVERWIGQKRSESGVINYLFAAETRSQQKIDSDSTENRATH